MRTSLTLTLALVALTAVGCGTGDYAAKDKAGTKVTTLNVIVGDRAATPSDEIARAFARRVAAASKGTIRIEVTATHQPVPSGSFAAGTIRKAARGGADVVAVPSRGFGGVGVATLLPLEVPMLVSSDDALDAVVRGDVADAMLAGVRGVGFEPLALVPDGLQFVVGFSRPLDTPAAFRRASVRAGSSSPVYAALSALGGRPSYTPGFRAEELAFQGRLTGTVVETARLTAALLAPGTVTANVPFGASTVTLAVTEAGWKRLDSDQRRLLVDSARSVAVASTTSRLRLRAAAAEMCREGNGVALADPQSLTKLQAVFDRIAAKVSSNSANRTLVAKLREIGRATKTQPVSPCRITAANQAQIGR